MTTPGGPKTLEQFFEHIASRRSAILSPEELLALIPATPPSDTQPEDAPTPRPAAASALPVTEATMKAAIADTFLVEELSIEGKQPILAAAPSGEDGGDDEELRALLGLSDTTVVAGQARLRLRPAGRADLLRRVFPTGRFRKLLRREYDRDVEDFHAIANDPIRVTAAWLRSFLVGVHGDIRTAPLTEVQAAVAALEALQDARDLLPPTVPSLDEARQRLQFAELVEPLRILIGSDGGWDGTAAKDRFVGRAVDLRELRSFVGELASESVGEIISRGFAASAAWALEQFGASRPRFMMVEAQGGLGKSSLIAKFVLDHVYGRQSDHFLFAYLDFDRAGLQARDSGLLLLEVVRQVALQTRDLGFQELHETLRENLAGSVQRQRSPSEEFRRLVRAWSDTSGSPFLLVLDTLEVAQFDPEALAAIDKFLSGLTEPLAAEPSPLAQLRIVGAGRAPLEALGFLKYVSSNRPLKLKPLGVRDARSMATALGRARLGAEWDERWSVRIAGTSAEEDDRREPLSVRVAADIVITAEPENREALSIDIAESGENSDESFVGRLYADRVLNHVRDPAVARLAWPGLILRHIDEEIAREVLAEVCGLETDAIGGILAKLAREVWMVESVSIGGRQMLRHRRELRARTLPLMRRQDPELFVRVNERVIAYFGMHATDPLARAEWIYHRLLGGEQPESVDSDWTPELPNLLADSHGDFRLGTPVRGYLLARTATAPLPRAMIETVPDWILFEHVGRACLSLAQFNESRLSGALLHISMTDPVRPLSADGESGRAALLVKAGCWSVEPPAQVAARWLPAWRFAESYRAARLREPRRPDAFPLPGPREVGIADHGWLSQLLAATALSHSKEAGAIDTLLADLFDHPTLRVEDLDAQSLRLAALFGEESCRPAARLWAARQYLSDRNPAEITVSGAELETLERQADWLAPIARENLPTILRFSKIASANAQPARLRDAELGLAMSKTVEQLSLAADPRIERLIRSFIAQRQTDWIAPLAYAAARALADVPAKELQPLVSRVRGYLAARSFLSRDDPEDLWIPASRDFVRLLCLADEASDLQGMVAEILLLTDRSRAAFAGDAPADDLEMLAKLLDRWRELVARHSLHAPASKESKADSPPAPPPVVNAADAQKHRWGGASERDGRRLTARVTTVRKSSFNVDLSVESADGSPLRPPVIFHLHPTFARTVIAIRRISEGKVATLYDVNAYGAFTVGAQVRNRSGRWTSLELDLVEVGGLPKRLHDV